MSSEGLLDWLRTQIHADRVIAQDALEDWVDGEDGDEMAGQVDSIRVGVHLVWWNPKRVLAECDAKRRIIDEHAAALANRKDHPDDLAGAGWLLGTIRALKLLALPYADREGYRGEWRP